MTLAKASALSMIDIAAGRASMADLLAAGGDERITLEAKSGLNRYGCGTWPRDDIAAFGSSTASVISGPALAAAERSLARLVAGPSLEAAYAQEMDGLRTALTQLCGLPAVSGSDLIFAASGTDLHLIAAVLASDGRSPLTAIMADAAETGRGVPNAVRGRRFGVQAPHGAPGVVGDQLAGAVEGEMVAIAVREPDGRPRPADEVDAEFERACARALQGGSRVLLNLVDVSKTGLTAPSRACATRLKARFGAAVTVLVDACQFRISGATLADYLGRDFIVAVTGSKFLTGPAFSGALFVAHAEAEPRRAKALLPALGAYCGQGDWHRSWIGRGTLPDRLNPGMMLRWQAALQELIAFRALADGDISAFAGDFEAAISATLEDLEGLQPLNGPAPARTQSDAWDARRTIFPFLPTNHHGPLNPERTQALHTRLMTGAAPIQLGQPVAIGARDGEPLTALRLSLSARLIVEALATPGGRDAVIARAQAALRETAVQALAL